jgi:hypothetical protein
MSSDKFNRTKDTCPEGMESLLTKPNAQFHLYFLGLLCPGRVYHDLHVQRCPPRDVRYPHVRSRGLPRLCRDPLPLYGTQVLLRVPPSRTTANHYSGAQARYQESQICNKAV